MYIRVVLGSGFRWRYFVCLCSPDWVWGWLCGDEVLEYSRAGTDYLRNAKIGVFGGLGGVLLSPRAVVGLSRSEFYEVESFGVGF